MHFNPKSKIGLRSFTLILWPTAAQTHSHSYYLHIQACTVGHRSGLDIQPADQLYGCHIIKLLSHPPYPVIHRRLQFYAIAIQSKVQMLNLNWFPTPVLTAHLNAYRISQIRQIKTNHINDPSQLMWQFHYIL